MTCAVTEFTGKERDAETGLDYFGARYLASAQGRFTSPDWSPTPQPVPFADLSNPQTLNLYSYVANNPLRTTDPNGHCGLDLNCWSEFGSGVADTTYRPIVHAVTNPVQTVKGVANAVAHPVDTAVAVKDAVVQTTNAALSGDPKAIGQVVGTVVSAVATAGAAKAVTSLAKGTATTNLYRAVGTAEADSIGAARAFTAAPNGTEFKGFFFAEADAQSFGSRMTQMTGDTHSVVEGAAPTKLVKNSPPHVAATEGRGVLIRNQDLPKVKVR
jgi:RHS repeat-associated protein